MRPTEEKLFLLFVVFLVFLGVVTAKLINLQIINHDYYEALARSQHTDSSPIPARRGTIFDRNRDVLVMSLPAFRVIADPQMIKDPRRVAARLAEVASLDKKTLVTRLSNGTRYALVARDLDEDKAHAIRGMRIEGLYFEPCGKRMRPLGDLAANVLGCLSADDLPLGGIELTYDCVLAGRPGLRIELRDARGRNRPCLESVVRTPVSGSSVMLTLDADLQRVAERELDQAVIEHRARGGCIVIVDPRSGDILALASNPRRGNIPVRMVFEPGSAFKICTISAALDLGRVSTAEGFDTHGGVLQVRGGYIRDVHPHKRLSVARGVEVSSNSVEALVARKIGKLDFYRYIRAFGFGSRTGIELEGEPNGILREPEQWSGRSLETLAIGQEIGVTPIQLAMAYAAIANGGKLLKPRLVKAVLDNCGNMVKRFPPRVVRRVVRETTAAKMTGLFQGVVDDGTGVLAGIAGIDVAGKTGTGQKARHGRYVPEEYYSVFAGYLPAGDPRYVCLVVIDEPEGDVHYGGTICGPVFKKVMEYLLRKEKSVFPSTCTRLVKRTEMSLAMKDES